MGGITLSVAQESAFYSRAEGKQEVGTKRKQGWGHSWSVLHTPICFQRTSFPCSLHGPVPLLLLREAGYPRAGPGRVAQFMAGDLKARAEVWVRVCIRKAGNGEAGWLPPGESPRLLRWVLLTPRNSPFCSHSPVPPWSPGGRGRDPGHGCNSWGQ